MVSIMDKQYAVFCCLCNYTYALYCHGLCCRLCNKPCNIKKGLPKPWWEIGLKLKYTLVNSASNGFCVLQQRFDKDDLKL